MTLTDPVADMLTRIRNANVAFHDDVVMPSSKLKVALAKILEQEGYISGSSIEDEEEIRLLAIPTGPGEEEFRAIARDCLPGSEIVNGSSSEEILFFREEPDVPLSQIKLLGGQAQEAYRQMLASELAPPHTRADITEWTSPREC